jgi:hypothetical protein
MKGKMPGFPLYRECAAGARRAADQGYPARSARPIPAGLPPIQGLKVDVNQITSSRVVPRSKPSSLHIYAAAGLF